MKKEDFLRCYSNLSNVELLKIIQEKEKYRPNAIEAAIEILSTRTYSDDDRITASAEVNFVLNEKTAQKGEQTK